MSKDKISVIIPAYNIEKYIERTVASVLGQSYKNLEIIIIDDGSTDGTGEAADFLSVRDERIHVIHQDNMGVAQARINGFLQSSGQWVSFVDGDDLLDPEMYTVLLSNARKYGADISHCGYQMVFPDRVDYYYNTGKILVQSKDEGIRELLCGDSVEPSLCNKLFSRKIFGEDFGWDKTRPSIEYMEDLLMNYYLFKKSRKNIYEDRCLYHYMIRENSAAMSQLNYKKLSDPLKVFYIIRKDTKDNKHLRMIIDQRICKRLIDNIMVMDCKDNRQIEMLREYSKRTLKKMLPYVLKGLFSLRLKVLSCLALISPELYVKVHDIYGSVSGNKDKYAL